MRLHNSIDSGVASLVRVSGSHRVASRRVASRVRRANRSSLSQLESFTHPLTMMPLVSLALSGSHRFGPRCIASNRVACAACESHVSFRQVAHEEATPQELVHRGQMLRLSFREVLPTEVRWA